MSDPKNNPDHAISAYYGVPLIEVQRLRQASEMAFNEGYRRGVEDAAKVAEAQPFYPDTHTGMRQQWVKDQIAAAIRSLTAPDKEGA